MRKVGVVGSGEVGRVLADGFLAQGASVMRGTREPAKLASWKKAAGANASVGTFEATAFVPELEHGETWPLPSYLGGQGCLDRIRFAVDPGDEVVYFGAAG